MRGERRPGCRDRRSQSTETRSKERTSAMRREWYLRRNSNTEMSAKSQGQTQQGSGLDGKGNTREGTGFRDKKAFANVGEAKSRHTPRFRPDESYGITKYMETGRGEPPSGRETARFWLVGLWGFCWVFWVFFVVHYLYHFKLVQNIFIKYQMGSLRKELTQQARGCSPYKSLLCVGPWLAPGNLDSTRVPTTIHQSEGLTMPELVVQTAVYAGHLLSPWKSGIWYVPGGRCLPDQPPVNSLSAESLLGVPG